MAKIINGSTIYLALANYLASNAYLNDTAQDVLIMVGKWIDEASEIDVPKWIPVSERLPDKPGYYLAYWHGHSCPEGMIDVLNFDGAVFPWNTLWKAAKNEVTHWMPIPELPKED